MMSLKRSLKRNGKRGMWKIKLVCILEAHRQFFKKEEANNIHCIKTYSYTKMQFELEAWDKVLDPSFLSRLIFLTSLQQLSALAAQSVDGK